MSLGVDAMEGEEGVEAETVEVVAVVVAVAGDGVEAGKECNFDASAA